MMLRRTYADKDVPREADAHVALAIGRTYCAERLALLRCGAQLGALVGQPDHPDGDELARALAAKAQQARELQQSTLSWRHFCSASFPAAVCVCQKKAELVVQCGLA